MYANCHFSIPTLIWAKFGDVSLGVDHDGGVPEEHIPYANKPWKNFQKFHCIWSEHKLRRHRQKDNVS